MSVTVFPMEFWEVGGSDEVLVGRRRLGGTSREVKAVLGLEKDVD